MNTQEALDVLEYANKLLKIAELGDQAEISEAIDVLRKAVEWQPIETLPKTGKVFLYNGTHVHNAVLNGRTIKIGLAKVLARVDAMKMFYRWMSMPGGE